MSLKTLLESVMRDDEDGYYESVLLIDPLDPAGLDGLSGTPAGVLVISLKALVSKAQAADPSFRPEKATLLRRLETTAHFRHQRLTSDLLLSLARLGEEIDQQEALPAAEVCNLVDQAVATRNLLYRSEAGEKFRRALDLPASDVLGPDRPRVHLADEVTGDDYLPLEFAEYVGAAIETGNGQALDAISTWMRQFVRPGAFENDWTTIVRKTLFTADAIADLAKAWAAGMTEEQLPQQSIVQRIRAVGLEVHTVLEAPPKRWPKYAREIVGAEYHVSPSVILKQIRQAQTR